MNNSLNKFGVMEWRFIFLSFNKFSKGSGSTPSVCVFLLRIVIENGLITVNHNDMIGEHFVGGEDEMAFLTGKCFIDRVNSHQMALQVRVGLKFLAANFTFTFSLQRLWGNSEMNFTDMSSQMFFVVIDLWTEGTHKTVIFGMETLFVIFQLTLGAKVGLTFLAFEPLLFVKHTDVRVQRVVAGKLFRAMWTWKTGALVMSIFYVFS